MKLWIVNSLLPVLLGVLVGVIVTHNHDAHVLSYHESNLRNVFNAGLQYGRVMRFDRNLSDEEWERYKTEAWGSYSREIIEVHISDK
jgi:hypothetical protein